MFNHSSECQYRYIVIVKFEDSDFKFQQLSCLFICIISSFQGEDGFLHECPGECPHVPGGVRWRHLLRELHPPVLRGPGAAALLRPLHADTSAPGGGPGHCAAGGLQHRDRQHHHRGGRGGQQKQLLAKLNTNSKCFREVQLWNRPRVGSLRLNFEIFLR